MKPHSQSSVCVEEVKAIQCTFECRPRRGEVEGSEHHTGTAAGSCMSQQPLCSHPPILRATSRAQHTPRDLGMDPHRWSLSACGFLSSSACVCKQLEPSGTLLWAIPSFMRAGFPSCQRPWHVTCFHRLDEDAMCTHKAWRTWQADVWISSVLLTDALKRKELEPDNNLTQPCRSKPPL